MKKLVLFFAMLIAFVCVNAQPLKQDKLFDETFIGVTVGTTGDSHGDWVGMNAGLRFGKWFTPCVGMELDGTAQFNDFYRTIRNHRVGANALANLNYLCGYNGKRSNCEFVPFVGLGWQRNYDIISNDLYTKMGLQVNVNFKHGWQFNIIPQVAYNLSAPSKLQYNVNYLDYDVALGVTYNFKNSHGTHFFKVCDKKYSQTEFDAMNGRINCLLEDISNLSKENAALADSLAQKPRIVVETTTVVETETYLPPVQFLFNSDEISETSVASIYKTAGIMINNPDKTYKVVGYASNEGSEAYNLGLSKRRAEAVANALIDFGVAPEQLIVVAGGICNEYPEPSLNRIVVISQSN